VDERIPVGLEDVRSPPDLEVAQNHPALENHLEGNSFLLLLFFSFFVRDETEASPISTAPFQGFHSKPFGQRSDYPVLQLSSLDKKICLSGTRWYGFANSVGDSIDHHEATVF
jgi:hypothetical protein